jgi:hypothetical protein
LHRPVLLPLVDSASACVGEPYRLLRRRVRSVSAGNAGVCSKRPLLPRQRTLVKAWRCIGLRPRGRGCAAAFSGRSCCVGQLCAVPTPASHEGAGVSLGWAGRVGRCEGTRDFADVCGTVGVGRRMVVVPSVVVAGAHTSLSRRRSCLMLPAPQHPPIGWAVHARRPLGVVSRVVCAMV